MIELKNPLFKVIPEIVVPERQKERAFPYILTNEGGRGRRRDKLSQENVFRRYIGDIQDAVHIGVSCWENYDIIAAYPANFAILFDSSPSVCELNNWTEQCLLHCEGSRERFLELFAKSPFVISEDKLPEGKKPPLWWLARGSTNEKGELEKELENPDSWLGSDEKFEIIYNMYMEKHVETVA